MPTQQTPLWAGMTTTGAVLWKWTVSNYAALSTILNQEDGDVCKVIDSQGTIWLPGTLGGTYYPSGFYTWDETAGTWKMDKTIEEIANALVASGGGPDTKYFHYSSIGNASLIDNTNFYLGWATGLTTSINGTGHVPLPAGKIITALFSGFNASTIGSNESIIVEIHSENGATIQTLTTALKVDSRHNFLAEVVDLDIVQGQSWLFVKVPSMSTNPNAHQLRVTLIIE